jgi:hypothetical protein
MRKPEEIQNRLAADIPIKLIVNRISMKPIGELPMPKLRT